MIELAIKAKDRGCGPSHERRVNARPRGRGDAGAPASCRKGLGGRAPDQLSPAPPYMGYVRALRFQLILEHDPEKSMTPDPGRAMAAGTALPSGQDYSWIMRSAALHSSVLERIAQLARGVPRKANGRSAT